jgi:hypothetical protein
MAGNLGSLSVTAESAARAPTWRIEPERGLRA